MSITNEFVANEEEACMPTRVRLGKVQVKTEINGYVKVM